MPAAPAAPTAAPAAPSPLAGLAVLLLCQSLGEAASRLGHWPLPGPVLGMLLLVLLLNWPPLRALVGRAADGLLAHLSLLFVPVGVGVVTHLALIAQHGLRMALTLVLSTLAGLAVTALVLQALLPVQADGPAGEPPRG